MEPRGTKGPLLESRTKDTIVTVQNLMGPRFPCYTVALDGTKEPL